METLCLFFSSPPPFSLSYPFLCLALSFKNLFFFNLKKRKKKNLKTSLFNFFKFFFFLNFCILVYVYMHTFIYTVTILFHFISYMCVYVCVLESAFLFISCFVQNWICCKKETIACLIVNLKYHRRWFSHFRALV